MTLSGRNRDRDHFCPDWYADSGWTELNDEEFAPVISGSESIQGGDTAEFLIER
jgi:hypothetical protein